MNHFERVTRCKINLIKKKKKSLCIRSPAEEHLGCFQVLVTMK